MNLGKKDTFLPLKTGVGFIAKKFTVFFFSFSFFFFSFACL